MENSLSFWKKRKPTIKALARVSEHLLLCQAEEIELESETFFIKESLMPTKALTKSALLQIIAQETDADRKTAAFFLDVITNIALREVKKAGEFTFPRIGKLVQQKRKARIGRNPKTGQRIKISAKTVVQFRVSKGVKDALLGMK